MKKDVVSMDRPASEDRVDENHERIVTNEIEIFHLKERVAESERMNERHEELIRMLTERVARLEDIIYQIAAQNGNVIAEPLPRGDDIPVYDPSQGKWEDLD